jgi:hypothetical protein
VIPEKFFELQMIDKVSAYYIVDPGLTKTNCNPQSDFKFKVIIAASPDEGHWGASSFSKKRGQSQGIFLYYLVWTLQEMIMACEIFIGNCTSISIAKGSSNLVVYPIIFLVKPLRWIKKYKFKH